jgi:hypothetical protein
MAASLGLFSSIRKIRQPESCTGETSTHRGMLVSWLLFPISR